MPVTASRRVPTRRLRRTALCAFPVSLASLLLAASPALARDDGEPSGTPLGAIETLLVFVGAPVGLFLLIAVLVLAPSMSRGPRYRPGVGWWAAPIWFNGPGEHENLDAVVRTATPTLDGGGASARW